MKKFLKKTLCLFISAIMLAACAGLAACEDIKTLEVKFSVAGADTEYTLNVDLYRHLAPETCAAIEKYAEEGFYNGMYLYKDSAYGKQIMVGDLKESENGIVLEKKDVLGKGEFEKGGTTGSNLLAEKGSVGLWRSWNAADADGNKYKSNAGMQSGRATWFMPTEAISDYDGYFCIFAVIDLDDSANSSAFSALTAVFDSSDNYESYVVYYTGEYNAEADNCGLTFNCVTKSEFEDVDEDTVFEAKGSQSVEYNKRTVSLSKSTKIISVTVK